jgi:hypothetical protein
LAVVVSPEFEWFAFSLRCQNLRGRDMDGVERAYVYRKGTFCAVDHGAIDWSQIQHREQISQLFPLYGRLGIVEIAEQPFAVDGAKSLDLQEFGRGNMIAREEGNCRSWLRE